MARSLLIYYATPFRLARLEEFSRSLLHPGDLAFDLGAHVGNHIFAWLRLGARVVAVEPQATFFRLLGQLYGGHPRVTLLNVAVGATPGRTELLLSRRTPTVSTLSPAWSRRVRRAPSFARVQWEVSDPVEVTTLDLLIARHGTPDFCKIDVEGMEAEVLLGLSRPLPALSFEYLPATPEVALGCLHRLQELGGYEFNWSEGESHRWALDAWVGVDRIREFLATLPLEARSGDVYARIRPPVGSA